MRFVLLTAIPIAFCAPLSFAYAEEQMERCTAQASAIHAGMTRAEIESRMVHDGGIMGIFKGERLFFRGSKPDEQPQKFCMLNIDFHPYGLSNSTYGDVNEFAKWAWTRRSHPNPKDVAVKVSAPFIDSFHAD